ncbi:MAG TPA: DUF1501 domain-containing protein, partial [Acidobacteriota bacterium]|nr:DUF1501 domain-containing protein [Acidobacteriota bacterium]
MTTCNRRELLQWSFRAGLGLTFGQTLGLTSLLADPDAKAKACILLWMAGGPSQIDTFDPKTNSATAGEFKPISTAVPGMQFCEHLPLLARESKDLAILRSMNSKEGNHDRARYFVHTGYAPAGVTQHPAFGAIVASELMQKSQTLPAYVSINGPAMPAGLLGVSFAPFVIRDAEKPPENLTYYAGISRERFEKRMELLNALNANFNADHGQPELEKKEMVYKKAIDLMNSPDLIAFDLSKEKDSI